MLARLSRASIAPSYLFALPARQSRASIAKMYILRLPVGSPRTPMPPKGRKTRSATGPNVDIAPFEALQRRLLCTVFVRLLFQSRTALYHQNHLILRNFRCFRFSLFSTQRSFPLLERKAPLVSSVCSAPTITQSHIFQKHLHTFQIIIIPNSIHLDLGSASWFKFRC